VSKKAFSHLTSLPQERKQDMDKMLLRGDPAAKVARAVQKDWGLLKDMKETSLAKTLQRYRAQVLKTDAAKKLVESGALEVVGGALKNADLIQEFTFLVTQQKRRVQTAMEKYEEGKPLLSNIVSNEMKLFGEILERAGRVFMETGVLPRVPKDIAGIIASKSQSSQTPGGQTRDANVVMFRVTDSTERAAQFFEGLRAATGT